jgi:hypothetical protein
MVNMPYLSTSLSTRSIRCFKFAVVATRRAPYQLKKLDCPRRPSRAFDQAICWQDCSISFVRGRHCNQDLGINTWLEEHSARAPESNDLRKRWARLELVACGGSVIQLRHKQCYRTSGERI